MPIRKPWTERFWEKVDQRGPGECWPWKKSLLKGGYGQMSGDIVDGKQQKFAANRCAFYLTHGYWPVVARHTCDNPPCCNPAHIIDGTVQLNAWDMSDRHRGTNQQVTHCPAGHEYTTENTYIYLTKHNGRPFRVCKTCRRARSKAYRDVHGKTEAMRKYKRDWVRAKRAQGRI